MNKMHEEQAIKAGWKAAQAANPFRVQNLLELEGIVADAMMDRLAEMRVEDEWEGDTFWEVALDVAETVYGTGTLLEVLNRNR